MSFLPRFVHSQDVDTGKLTFTLEASVPSENMRVCPCVCMGHTDTNCIWNIINKVTSASCFYIICFFVKLRILMTFKWKQYYRGKVIEVIIHATLICDENDEQNVWGSFVVDLISRRGSRTPMKCSFVNLDRISGVSSKGQSRSTPFLNTEKSKETKGKRYICITGHDWGHNRTDQVCFSCAPPML